MSKTTSTPNAEQQAVIDLREGAFAVLAGPGAGKTTVLVRRYVQMLEEGIKPEDILNLTFTAASAKHMRDQAEAQTTVRKMDESRVCGWMTFHSLALQFAQKERESFGFPLAEFPLCPEPLANKLCWESAKRFDADPRRLRSYISLQKRNRVRPSDAIKNTEKEHKDEKLALGYKHYEAKLRENKVLDFDSLVFEMIRLLELCPQILDRWSYKWVAADESQDNDISQIRLLQLLTKKHGNILLVGDPGQNLYSFRGSFSAGLSEMAEHFPGAKKLYLGCNFRSTPQIVEFVRSVGPVPDLAEKFHTLNPSGPEPVITQYAGPAEEAAAVVSQIKETGGTANHTIGVLARTNRALRPIEDALSVAGIKYRYIGKSGFWAQPEIKAAVAYLTCAHYPADYAVSAALRAPFWPSKYIKKTELAEKLKKRSEDVPALAFLRAEKNEAVGTFVHFLDSLRRYRDLPTKDAVTKILNELKVWDHYSEHEDPDNSPVENLQELVRIAGRFSSLKEFLDYIRRASAASKSKKAVALSTVHGAKGLEFNTVFLIQVSEGILPHAKAESIEDEKNVFFVGASRAERDLRISYSGQPSRFLTPFLKKESH